MKKYAIILVILVFMAFLNALVVSAESKLVISRVDVDIDGKYQDDINEGMSVEEKAKPQSEVSIIVEFENKYKSSEDIRIEDIQAEAKIKNIDDSNDMKEKTEKFSLNPDDTIERTFLFTLPLAVDEGTYDVIITVDGADRNNTGIIESDEFDLRIKVAKKSREIRIIKAELFPSTVNCNQDLTFDTEIINLGTKIEENASLQIYQGNFGINLFDKGIKLVEDPFDDNNIYRKSYSFIIPSNTTPGVYTARVEAFFDGIPADLKDLQFTVQCNNDVQQSQQSDANPQAPQAQDQAPLQPLSQDNSDSQQLQSGSVNDVPVYNTDTINANTINADTSNENLPEPQDVQPAQPISVIRRTGYVINQMPQKPRPFVTISSFGYDFYESREYLITLVMINVIIACGIIYLISLMIKKR